MPIDWGFSINIKARKFDQGLACFVFLYSVNRQLSDFFAQVDEILSVPDGLFVAAVKTVGSHAAVQPFKVGVPLTQEPRNGAVPHGLYGGFLVPGVFHFAAVVDLKTECGEAEERDK